MARLRYNFQSGILNLDLPIGGTTISSPALASFPAVTGSDYATAMIGNEILHITAHTAFSQTATVLRGQESSVEQAHFSGDEWEHGPTAFDFNDTVHLDGVENITDIKHFSVSPTVPDPVGVTDVANKEYADTKLQRSIAGGYANLASLPSASAHAGEIQRTLDGGIYESISTSWKVLRDPASFDGLVLDGVTDDGPNVQALFDRGLTRIGIPGGKTLFINSPVFFDQNLPRDTIAIEGLGPQAIIKLGDSLPTCDSFVLGLDVKWAFFTGTLRAALSSGVVHNYGATVGKIGVPYNAARSGGAITQGARVIFRNIDIDGSVCNSGNCGLIFSQGDAIKFENMHLTNIKYGGSHKLYVDFSSFDNVFHTITTTVPGTITRTLSTNSGGTTILDPLITLADAGKPISHPNIPPGCYVAYVNANVSFQLGTTPFGGANAVASATGSGTAIIGVPWGYTYVQLYYGDNITWINAKTSGPVNFWYARHCHGGSVQSAVAGGFHFTECYGITIDGWHKEMPQPLFSRPGLYMSRSKITLVSPVNSRGFTNFNENYWIEINDEPAYSEDGSDLLILHPRTRVNIQKSTTPDSATSPDIYIYNANVAFTIRILGQVGGMLDKTSERGGPDSITVGSNMSAINTALQQSTYGSPLGLLAGDWRLSYYGGAWKLDPDYGLRVINAQATPTGLTTSLSQFPGALTASTTYAYAAATIDDDGLVTAACAEVTYVPPAVITTQVASGSNNVDVATFVGNETLNVTSASAFTTDKISIVTSDGSTAVISYTGTTSTTFTGCFTETGSGTLSTGATVSEVNNAAKLTLSVTAPKTGLIVWRKTATGVLSAPTRYCIIPVRSTYQELHDTGGHLNGRPWITTSVPVPNTSFAATTSTQDRTREWLGSLLYNNAAAALNIADSIKTKWIPDLNAMSKKMGVALSESFVRHTISNLTGWSTSGTAYFSALTIPAGITISNLACYTGTTALGIGATTDHRWLALADNNFNMLAVTADLGGQTAWGSNSKIARAIATIASGSSGTFTTTYAGLYYILVMVAETGTGAVLPSYLGISSSAAALGAESPKLAGAADVGNAGPPSFPFTFGPTGAGGGGSIAYVYVT